MQQRLHAGRFATLTSMLLGKRRADALAKNQHAPARRGLMHLPLTGMHPCERRADTTGQTALHWSAVRGSLLAAEALLGGGADSRLRDGRGYTACHVAAQYGQTSWLYMAALRWRADVDRSGTPCLAGSPSVAR